MKDLFQDIYIYVNKRGVIHELPGYISKKKPMKLAYAIPAFDPDDNILISEVAREPGMIFNNTVWFKKKDFNKAKELFMNEYGEKINQLYSELNTAQEEMSFLAEQEEVKE